MRSSSIVHALTGSDFTRPFYHCSKIQSSQKLLFQPSTTKLIYSLSSKKAIIAQVIDFILHVVYNKPKRESSPMERRYAMLLVTKGKKKNFIETKLFLPDEQLLHMKILRANFVSCG